MAIASYFANITAQDMSKNFNNGVFIFQIHKAASILDTFCPKFLQKIGIYLKELLGEAFNAPLSFRRRVVGRHATIYAIGADYTNFLLKLCAT